MLPSTATAPPPHPVLTHRPLPQRGEVTLLISFLFPATPDLIRGPLALAVEHRVRGSHPVLPSHAAASSAESRPSGQAGGIRRGGQHPHQSLRTRHCRHGHRGEQDAPGAHAAPVLETNRFGSQASGASRADGCQRWPDRGGAGITLLIRSPRTLLPPSTLWNGPGRGGASFFRA